MPRPGKRPYECERRAWHSDRHQPMRGSLIQEIFRVVNETHSTATKNNKEWQEKLPIVVLRAEEIMYSKANSEAEYMDLKTIWDRANDAINTIIPEVESTEAGELLQPCIEAALHLGCTPRRGSRSQRNINPSCYLSPTSPEPICAPPGNLENLIQAKHPPNLPFVSHISYFMKPTPMSVTLLGSESLNSAPRKNNHSTSKFPLLDSVYPLCYGKQHQSQVSESSFVFPPNLNLDNAQPSGARRAQNFFPRSVVDASSKIPRADARDIAPENPQGIECDLSLRLGPLSVLSIKIENSPPREEVDEDNGSSTSREVSKLSNLTLQMASGDDALDSCSNKWRSSETQGTKVGTGKRNREAISYPFDEDGEFCWQQPKIICNHLTGGFEQGRFVD